MQELTVRRYVRVGGEVLSILTAIVSPGVPGTVAEEPIVGMLQPLDRPDDNQDEDFSPLSRRLEAIAPSSMTQPIHYSSDYTLDVNGWPPIVYLHRR